MGVDGGVFALKFDGLLGAGDGVESSAKNVGAGVAVDVTFGLLHFNQLRPAFKIIEQEDAGRFGKAESGCDLRETGFREETVGFGFFFLVESGSLGDGGSGTVLFVFFGGGPVDQRRGEFFPFVALGAHVAHAVALYFIFADQLVGAVFEDQAVGEFLGGGMSGSSAARAMARVIHERARLRDG